MLRSEGIGQGESSRRHTSNAQSAGCLPTWRASAQGFQNYPKEWWHFSLSLPGYDTHRDFPVSPRPDGG